MGNKFYVVDQFNAHRKLVGSVIPRWAGLRRQGVRAILWEATTSSAITEMI
ncbi:MAG: hypothetical protein U0894_08525 [Pirellulales bacterium]